MKLESSQLVTLRNGKIGVVDNIVGKPHLVVFPAFTRQVKCWDENLKSKNGKEDYDIISIHDGSSITEPSDIFKKSFKTDGLDLVWEENK